MSPSDDRPLVLHRSDPAVVKARIRNFDASAPRAVVTEGDAAADLLSCFGVAYERPDNPTVVSAS